MIWVPDIDTTFYITCKCFNSIKTTPTCDLPRCHSINKKKIRNKKSQEKKSADDDTGDLKEFKWRSAQLLIYYFFLNLFRVFPVVFECLLPCIISSQISDDGTNVAEKKTK